MRRYAIAIAIASFAVAFAACLFALDDTADAAPCNPRQSWCRTEVSWYGPGFYWNTFACGRYGTYNPRDRGFAHRTLRCGTLVQVCHRRIYTTGLSRCVIAPIVDRGPYVSGRDLDATGRTAVDLCGCRHPYTMPRSTIRWRVAP